MTLLQHLLLGSLGGFAYGALELLYRGRTHGSMVLAGALSFWMVGMINEAAPWMPLPAQAIWGAALITALELLTGLAVNRRLTVWNYTACPCNFRGQICLPYSLLWVPLALTAVFLDDALRLLLFHQAPPVYRWF